MKLYIVPGGPPSLAVQQTLKYLDIPYELIEVNYGAGDHLNSEYSQVIPVFLLDFHS
jgi:glutathione S-transferase